MVGWKRTPAFTVADELGTILARQVSDAERQRVALLSITRKPEATDAHGRVLTTVEERAASRRSP